MSPRELGCGPGMMCWRRLRDWQAAGTLDLMHFALLDSLARHAESTDRAKVRGQAPCRPRCPDWLSASQSGGPRQETVAVWQHAWPFGETGDACRKKASVLAQLLHQPARSTGARLDSGRRRIYVYACGPTDSLQLLHRGRTARGASRHQGAGWHSGERTDPACNRCMAGIEGHRKSGAQAVGFFRSI